MVVQRFASSMAAPRQHKLSVDAESTAVEPVAEFKNAPPLLEVKGCVFPTERSTQLLHTLTSKSLSALSFNAISSGPLKANAGGFPVASSALLLELSTVDEFQL
ncbi:hypothetical protein LEN26_006581 [Aphanomyces euteiches]|nr:hypothetical protein AeMF1_005977 [Aphanomyces euteiches]KAH9135101.1 hypothetical protein LEN26_006581 [Aphanomyces euteiches]KAH9184979.1 hypothetical protein AeNC1_013045 [Aphanomyces euteiches]